MRDFNLGAGGTFPTQALIFTPATLTEHVPHSPFLHFVGTLNPNFWHAWNKGKIRQFTEVKEISPHKRGKLVIEFL